MHFDSTLLRDWKTTLKTVTGILTLLATVFILSMPVEAVLMLKDAVVRASDGNVYEIQYMTDHRIENFHIRGLNGEVPSRQVAAELYNATKVLSQPPLQWTSKYLELEVENAYRTRLDHELVLAVTDFAAATLIGYYTGGSSWLDLALNAVKDGGLEFVGFTAKDVVLSKAMMIALRFASDAKHYEAMVNTHWLAVDRRNETSINEIKAVWSARLKEGLYQAKTYEIMANHIFSSEDPLEHILGWIPTVPLLSAADFFQSRVLEKKEIEYLDALFETTQEEITNTTAPLVDAIFGEAAINKTIAKLEQAGFYDRKPPERVGTIADEWLTLGGDPQRVDMTNRFSDPNGDPLDLALKEDFNKSVVDVKWTLFRRAGESEWRSVLEITPKNLGETWVTVEATDPSRLSVTQRFKVIVAPANSPPQIIKTLSAQTLTLGSSSLQLDLDTYFMDLDSASISYTAQSNNTAVATVERTGSVITISGIGIGAATLTVTATDSDGSSTEQTFNVTVTAAPVQNRAPRVSSQIPAHALTVGNSAALLSVSDYFNDPDGDTLIYTSSTSHTAVVTASTSGSPVLITPVAAGTATITVTASDGKLTATQSFTVTITDPPVQNRAPRVSSQIPVHALTVGNSAALLSVSDYFNDPDGDTLTYTSNTSHTAVVTVSPSGSPVVITPVAAGTATITVTASDGELIATQSFTVTVTDPPVQNQAPEVTNSFNRQNFRVDDAPKWRNLSSYFSDPDDDTLTYTATSSNNRIVAAIISGNSVKITPGAPGTARVTVTAQDTGGLTVAQSFTVTVQAKLQTVPSLPVCNRTPQVRDEIMKRTRDNNCANVTEDELESITRLSLIAEGLVTLKQGDFDELRNLEDLVLNENSLRTLPAEVFWYLRELQALSLRDNQFTTLVKDTFEHLDSLTYLTLRGNRLTTLQQGAFDDLEMLIELDLRDNQLTTLPAGVFEDLPNLEELNLEDNRIAILSRGGFLGLSSLTDLELDGNPLQTIEAGAFNGLSSLTDLEFNGYPLRKIEAGAFSGLSSLTDLDVYDTQLSTLPRNVFSGLSSLTDLELTGNPIQTIEAGAFSGLSSLTDLDLSDAQLSTLRQDVFSGLSSLENLDLDGNPLQTIEVGAFSGLSSLTDLDLDDAQLSTLRQDVFSGLSSLENLDLYGNSLRAIEIGAFNGLSNLISLSLDENRLTTLPVGIFSGLSKLERLDLRDNPGAPFTLTLELARTDTTNLKAAGPATVKMKLAEGAPFDMSIRLSVQGGTLSADIATLTVGQIESNPITVRQTGTALTTVRLGSVPTIPQGYRGIQMAVGTPLVLFSEQLNHPPVAVGTIPAQILTVGDAAIVVNVSDKFNDADGDTLHYTASSDNTNVVSVSTSGTQVTLVPKRVGNASVTVTASDGTLTATQTLSVSVAAAPTENEAPVAIGVIPVQSLTLDGASSTVDLSVYFSDANGDTLTYAVWPDDKHVVRLERKGTLLTIIPKAAGRATVTVKATDPDGLEARQRISVLVSTTEVPVTELPAETWMPDANLRAAVRNALGLAPNDPLTQQAILALTRLRYLGPDLNDTEKIADLTGLEYALNLEHLDLYAHLISDLRPLAGLVKLRSLWLAGNKIANIRSLTNLPLEELDLGGNPINDFAPLAELTSLTRLAFWGNGLGNSDLSIITGLTQLTQLDLRGNKISDISSLRKLVNLKKLQLEGNPITDTSLLLNLTSQNPNLEIDIEIGEGPPSEPDTEVEAEVPDLFVESIRAGKTTVDPGDVFRVDAVIRNQGKAASGAAKVHFYRSVDDTITTSDTKVRTSDMPALAADRTKNRWARLTAPDTSGVYYYGVCIEGVENESDRENNCSTAVKITVGPVRAKPPVVERPTTAPETSESLAKQAFQKHGKTLRRQDVKAVLPEVLTTLKEPNIQALLTPATIDRVIADPDILKTIVPTISDKFITLMKEDAAIKTLLSDAQVQTLLQTPAAIDELARLLGISVGIATTADSVVVFRDANLAKKVREALNLPTGAAIPKAKLATLTWLVAEHQRITDLTGLESATALAGLYLWDNSISNISVLSGLTSLEALDLNGNEINDSDLNVLSGLTSLYHLELTNNSISDLRAISGLTSLESLYLRWNFVSDLRAISGLTRLTHLGLNRNLIRDISALSGLTLLESLDLKDNSITDVSPLQGLKRLRVLLLNGNPSITDFQPLRVLQTAVEAQGVTVVDNLGSADLAGYPQEVQAAQRSYVSTGRAKPVAGYLLIDVNIGVSGAAPSISVLPDETALLSNYPNPFNPETWIPYQIAEAADVTLTIYDLRGVVVRRLVLGHRPPGFYQSRARAAHWDGRNEIGEKVASGLYFYTFTAGDFTATQKLLIRK